MTLVVRNYPTESPGTPLIVSEMGYLVQSIPSLAPLGERLRSMVDDLLAPQEIGKTAYKKGDSGRNAMEIDFAGAESSMRQIVRQQGLDFDKLAQKASEHFRDPAAAPYASDLTDEQINLLADDDDQALHR